MKAYEIGSKVKGGTRSGVILSLRRPAPDPCYIVEICDPLPRREDWNHAYITHAETPAPVAPEKAQAEKPAAKAPAQAFLRAASLAPRFDQSSAKALKTEPKGAASEPAAETKQPTKKPAKSAPTWRRKSKKKD